MHPPLPSSLSHPPTNPSHHPTTLYPPMPSPPQPYPPAIPTTPATFPAKSSASPLVAASA